MQPIENTLTKREYAEQYINKGFFITKCYHVKTDGTCSCGRTGAALSPCKPGSEGKHGGKDWMIGSNKIADFDRWLADDPNMNIGILPGKKSGIWVLDIDPKNGGDSTLKALIDSYGELPETLTAKSGSGGRHYYFQFDERMVKNQTNAGKRNGDEGHKGIDVKSAGGLIIAPPSINKSGTYQWCSPIDSTPIAQAPEWLIAELEPEHKQRPKLTQDGRKKRNPWEGRQTDITQLQDALSYIDNDDRDIWLAVGMALKLDDAGHYSLWCEWSGTSHKFDQGDQTRVWNSIKNTGSTLTTLGTVYWMAENAGWERKPLFDAERKKNQEAGAPLQKGLQKRSEEKIKAEAQAKAEAQVIDITSAQPVNSKPVAPEKPERRNKLIDFDNSEDAKPLDFVVEDFLVAKVYNVIWGSDGTGKSLLATDMALCVSHGIPWNGRDVKKGPVLYVAGEGHEDMKNRVKAWKTEKGLLDQPTNFFFTKMEYDLTRSEDFQEIFDHFNDIVEAKQCKPPLIIVDTLSSNFGQGSVNDDAIVRPIVHGLMALARETGAAVLLVHHSGKDREKGAMGAFCIQGEAFSKAEVTRCDDEIKLTQKKMRGATEQKPMFFDFKSVDLGMGVNHKGVEVPMQGAIPVLSRDENAGEISQQNIAKKGRAAGSSQIKAIGMLNDWVDEMIANKPDLTEFYISRNDLYKKLGEIDLKRHKKQTVDSLEEAGYLRRHSPDDCRFYYITL